MKTTVETFLASTAPKGGVSVIPHHVAQKIELLNSELYDLLSFAHAELAAIHQPADLRGSLTPWEGHEPLSLEWRADPHGKAHLLDIRCRGASVSEYLAPGLWDEAEAWLQANHGSTPPAIVKRAAAADRLDVRSELAA